MKWRTVHVVSITCSAAKLQYRAGVEQLHGGVGSNSPYFATLQYATLQYSALEYIILHDVGRNHQRCQIKEAHSPFYIL